MQVPFIIPSMHKVLFDKKLIFLDFLNTSIAHVFLVAKIQIICRRILANFYNICIIFPVSLTSASTCIVQIYIYIYLEILDQRNTLIFF
jgi:hypothetical protein